MLVNLANFATIYLTASRQGGLLRLSESLLEGVCHRMPSRSFWISEIPLGLCSRCTGIYLSAFITMLFVASPVRGRLPGNTHLLLALLLPLVADALLEHFGVYTGSNTIRFVTGFLFGYALVRLLGRLLQLTTPLTHIERTPP